MESQARKVVLFGDEGSSSAVATYGLIAILESDLRAVARLIDAAKSTLKATFDEPLHCRVLFHRDRRLKSAFCRATETDVHRACVNLIAGSAALPSNFYFGLVDRKNAPKILHFCFGTDDTKIVRLKLKLELPHLQHFAYGGAAAKACDTLKYPVIQVLADENRSMVQWFNQRSQAARIMETISMDATLPNWPKITLANDKDHPGLQLADVLTYFGTRQLVDRRFAETFDLIRHKSRFMGMKFDGQVYRPYEPTAGV